MSTHLKPFAAVLCFAGLIGPTFAASSNGSASIEQLSSQTKALQNEVFQLRQEVANLKSGQANGRYKPIQKPIASAVPGTAVSSANTPPTSGAVEHPAPLTRSDLMHLVQQQQEYLPFDLDVPGQAFVSTGPYVGVPIQFAGDDLVVNSPSVNTDVQLLGIRKSIHRQLLAMGGELFKEPYHSHLLLSGVVQADANYTNIGGAPSQSSVDVNNVSLDAFFLGPSNWTLGFIEFSYDNGPSSNNSYIVSNSRVYVNKAFITIGDFAMSPIYGSVGQFYVPFGTYSSVMVSDPLTKLIFRTKARAILVGFQQQGDNAWYGSTYIFRGDSHAASVSKINNGGINIGYKFKGDWLSGNIGGGVIGNIADSAGFQLGDGFAYYEQLSHRVPAYDLRALLGLGQHIDIIAEYLIASTSFNIDDMRYKSHGAKPSASDFEGVYTFMAWDRPTSVGIGYGTSSEALTLGIPLTRYSLVLNTSIWRNTLQSLEFRHDRNYAESATGNGPVGAATTPGACTAVTCTASGKGDNAVTAQFAYYF